MPEDDGFLESLGLRRPSGLERAVNSMVASGLSESDAKRLVDSAPIGKALVDIPTRAVPELYAATRALTDEQARDVAFTFALSLARLRELSGG